MTGRHLGGRTIRAKENGPAALSRHGANDYSNKVSVVGKQSIVIAETRLPHCIHDPATVAGELVAESRRRAPRAAPLGKPARAPPSLEIGGSPGSAIVLVVTERPPFRTALHELVDAMRILLDAQERDADLYRRVDGMFGRAAGTVRLNELGYEDLIR